MGDIILSGGAGGSSSGGDGAILDGVSSSIKATVLDLTDSNPVTVAIVDTNGDQITSFGGGTQYVENTALESDPTGTALIGRARTVFGVAESGIAGGDSVIINATTAGELWVVDATCASVLGTITTQLADESAIEDAVMDADPTGKILIGRARSTPASEGVSDGDAVTLNATTKGELYVKHTDTIPVSVATGAGQTLLFAAISQGAAGTTTLVSADATKKIKVVSYVFVMSAAGTAKFIDSTPTDLTGAMAIAANGGVSAIGNSFSPLFATAVNKSLQIVTTVGAAAGHISYFLEA